MERSGKIFFNYFIPYVCTLLIAVLIVGILFSGNLKKSYQERARHRLQENALLIRNTVSLELFESPLNAQKFCREISQDTDLHVTLFSANGTVLGASGYNTTIIKEIDNQLEVKAALMEGTNQFREITSRGGRDILFFALPIVRYDEITGVVRVAAPVMDMPEILIRTRRQIVLVGLGVLIVSVLLLYLISRNLDHSMSQLRETIKLYGEESQTGPLQLRGPKEIVNLSRAFRDMTRQVSHRYETVLSQKNELEAVLKNMSEPVILLDNGLKIRKVNDAAVNLLKKDSESLLGNSLIKVYRNTAVFNVAEETVKEGRPITKQIVIPEDQELFIQVKSTPIEPGPLLSEGGVLLVLNDLTEIRKAEEMSKAFVANVSHELKTPLTLVRGFVETLSDEDLLKLHDQQKFFSIIERHVERMEAIIDDLLSLSQLEKKESVDIERIPILLEELMASAVSIHEVRAEEKGITIETHCSNDLEIYANPLLLEQALSNLLDNSVKYTANGGDITIRAERNSQHITISVADNGAGIPAKDLPRIFERFYRVEKARSRELGGTGLGLSIVKHIVLVHGGKAVAESVEGKGSVFTLYLPVQKTASLT